MWLEIIACRLLSHQTTVTLRSPFRPLFLMCGAGGLGLGGPWLLAHPPFTPVLKSLLLPGPNSGKTSMLSEQPEGDSLSLTLTFPGRVERAVEPGILWEEGFEWNQSPPHSFPHPSKGQEHYLLVKYLPAHWRRKKSGFAWLLASFMN